MTDHHDTIGPERFKLIEEKQLRLHTVKRPLATRIEAGDRLILDETVPNGSRNTGWRMECTILHVASHLTPMPGLDRDYVALSLEVIQVYPNQLNPAAP